MFVEYIGQDGLREKLAERGLTLKVAHLRRERGILGGIKSPGGRGWLPGFFRW